MATPENDRDRWCPVCRTTAKWYETQCPTCGGALVDQAGGDAPDPDAALVPVFEIKDAALLPLAEMALEGAGIEYTVRAANVLIPGLGKGPDHTGFDNAMPGQIVVLAEDAARARELVAELNQSPPPNPAANEPTPAEWNSPSTSPSDPESE